MNPSGQFTCSNPMLNQLQHNIQWGQKGNLLDVPTDCPQRDERLGWTGDAQAFSRTASFNMDVHNFFAKWMNDVAADQSEDGRVPFVVPNVLGPMSGGSAGWADVSTIIPWNMWLVYGDPKILEDQYLSMKGWVDFMQDHSTDSLRAQAAKRLVNNIQDYDNHLTTGFLGTPYLCEVLTRYGYDTVSYKLLLQETYPSWLYPVKMGATTIWERWDGQKPDSSFQTPGMNSFNHYAYGAIGDWMYRNITGLDTDDEDPGYKKIQIRPHPGGNLESANAILETLYGKLVVQWKISEGKFMMD